MNHGYLIQKLRNLEGDGGGFQDRKGLYCGLGNCVLSWYWTLLLLWILLLLSWTSFLWNDGAAHLTQNFLQMVTALLETLTAATWWIVTVMGTVLWRYVADPEKKTQWWNTILKLLKWETIGMVSSSKIGFYFFTPQLPWVNVEVHIPSLSPGALRRQIISVCRTPGSCRGEEHKLPFGE